MTTNIRTIYIPPGSFYWKLKVESQGIETQNDVSVSAYRIAQVHWDFIKIPRVCLDVKA